MRYDSMRKLKRNQMLRDYAEAHPELSLKEIAEVFRISRQRVQYLLRGHRAKQIKGGDSHAAHPVTTPGILD